MNAQPQLLWEMKPPPLELTDYVAGYWKFHNASDVDYTTIVVPDGRADVIFFNQNNAFQCILRGLDLQPGTGVIPAGATYFAINFKLLAVEYLIEKSIRPVINGGVQLPANWWEITGNDMDNFELFCQKISRKLISLIKSVDIRKQRLFAHIYSTNGTASVQDLSEKAGWSSRQMNRYFHDWFGLSLKAYCNIVRMSASFKDISTGKLFPDLDYTDQNHFIKEIKKYTGVTPKELSKNNDNRFAIISALKNIAPVKNG